MYNIYNILHMLILFIIIIIILEEWGKVDHSWGMTIFLGPGIYRALVL